MEQSSQPQWNPKPHQHHPAMPVVTAILATIIVIAGYLVAADYLHWWPYGTTSQEHENDAQPTPQAVTYTNEQYGFAIPLPTSWTGYTVLNETWEGRDIATGNVTEHGPLIKLRHPQWKQSSPREDMPIMVFTPAQWSLIQQEQLSVGAAPFGPSELGRNSQYVLALPARYNYDFLTGWEEVDQLVHGLKVMEPR